MDWSRKTLARAVNRTIMAQTKNMEAVLSDYKFEVSNKFEPHYVQLTIAPHELSHKDQSVIVCSSFRSVSSLTFHLWPLESFLFSCNFLSIMYVYAIQYAILSLALLLLAYLALIACLIMVCQCFCEKLCCTCCNNDRRRSSAVPSYGPQPVYLVSNGNKMMMDSNIYGNRPIQYVKQPPANVYPAMPPQSRMDPIPGQEIPNIPMTSYPGMQNRTEVSPTQQLALLEQRSRMYMSSGAWK